MSTTKSKRHTHKYYRGFLNSTRVWVCALPDCTHYMPKHMETQVLGKASICWKCEEDMILDAITLKMDKPICSSCRGMNEITQYLEDKKIINPITGE